jgi:magnesium chelatase subunit H
LQIVEAVSPLRENLDACLIFPSMPAVMKLNKLGTFSMAQLGQSKSVFSEFIKSARKVRAIGVVNGCCSRERG